MALPDAHIYLEGRPPVLLARSDAHGRFAAGGLCQDSPANVSAHRDGFATALAPIVSNGSGVAVAHLTLHRLGEHHKGDWGSHAPLRGMHGAWGRDLGGQPRLVAPSAAFSPAEKPYMVLHPKAKVRVAGQEVTFCCKASGTPVPKKYYW